MLTGQGTLKLMVEATTDKGTIINLAQHSYFNMAGHASGTILEHQLTINGYAPAAMWTLLWTLVIATWHLRSCPAGNAGALQAEAFPYKQLQAPAFDACTCMSWQQNNFACYLGLQPSLAEPPCPHAGPTPGPPPGSPTCGTEAHNSAPFSAAAGTIIPRRTANPSPPVRSCP